MCGLTSAFYPDGVTPPSVEALQRGLDASLETIKHRGPDSRGTYVSPDGRVGLGHVRLSIIDLPTGQQPLSDEDDLIYCVVTGEIYDHDRIRAEMENQGYSFKTKSDSELVVQLYKRDGFNLLFHLRGEFAFVLYDATRRLLFAARDRFGIKPLYYTVSNGAVLFGSEMKAFMGLGWQAEWDIDSIVDNGDVCDERTVFKGVQKLPAGYFALCRASGVVETQAYWDLAYPPATAAPSDSVDTMIVRVRELLVDAVRLRLRADVPWAVYLSGGIDSSAVAGIAVHLLREKDPNAKLTTFTLAYVEDATTDESPLAEQTATHLGVDLIKVEATEAKLVGLVEESIWHSEHLHTTLHGAGKLLLSKAVHEAGYKVALSGEGSDEVFGGYPFLAPDYLRQPDCAAAALGIPLPSDTERRALGDAIQAAGRGMYMPRLPADASPRPRLLDISLHRMLSTIMPSFSALLFVPDVARCVGAPDIVRAFEEGVDARVRAHSVSGHWHSMNVSLYLVSKALMGRIILNINGDRNDMANSVESRVAFLDHPLVEYVSNLPPSLKIRPIQDGGADGTPGKWSLTEKWILRQAVQPFVTPEVYGRTKVPFNPPPAPAPPPSSLDSSSDSASPSLLPLQAHLKARITQANVEKLGFLDWAPVRDLLDAFLTEPTFPAQGGIDARARVLMAVLTYVVLQERFRVPAYKI
ncbi:putative asparagine synthase [Mycena olivaceomarginata]|nr:putative asparagine synthase [Mycena olivaceomarginata]